MIDEVKRWWDENICNLRHSAAPVDSLQYSLQVTARKYKVEPHIPRFAEFGKWKGKKVLIAGCGIGTMALSFAKAGADTRAFDISEKSIRIALKRAAAEGLLLKNLWFAIGDMEQLSEVLDGEKPKPFDLIWSFGVLHHTPDPAKALTELRKFARPAGIIPTPNSIAWGRYVPPTELRIMLYNRWSWKTLWILARNGWRFHKAAELIARESEANTGCPVTRTYTKREAARLLRSCGWEPTSMTVDHIFPYRIRDYIKHRYVKEWHWRLTPRPLFRLLERLFGWHMLIKAVPK